MKNEATKFFKEYFKVHEQDMEIYEDTIDCLVKFAEKVNNPDVSKMPIFDLRLRYQQLKEQFNAVHIEICKRENDVRSVNETVESGDVATESHKYYEPTNKVCHICGKLNGFHDFDCLYFDAHYFRNNKASNE
jgi:hypothetical protein